MIGNQAQTEALLDQTDKAGGNSLTRLLDWQEWWQAWGPRIAGIYGQQPWILFAMDALEKEIVLNQTLARIIRHNPKDNRRGWTPLEDLNIAEQTVAALVWYEANQPDPKDVPEFMQFLFRAQLGMFRAMMLVGKELREVQRTGAHTVTIGVGEDGTHFEID